VGATGKAHPIEGTSRHYHKRRDVAALLVKEGVHLERSVEVVLAVEDRDADIVALVQQGFQTLGGLDLDRLIAGLSQLRTDGDKLRVR
jgi:hypothetical protein